MQSKPVQCNWERHRAIVTALSRTSRPYIGVALLRLGRLEEALASFERSLALDPDLAVAQAGLRQVRRALQQ